MDESTPRTRWTAYLPPILALVILAGLSGAIVWATHAGGVVGFLLAILPLGFLGLLIAALVGAPVLSAFAAMVVFAGTIEGIHQGARLYGWPGAILGAVLGCLVGHLVGTLPIILLVIFVKVEPSADSSSNESSENGPPPPQDSRGMA